MRISASMRRLTLLSGVCAFALCAFTVAVLADDQDRDRDRRPQTGPRIKHVIVVLGENRGFDHVFGVYKPKNGQRIDNLLSRGIVDEDGRPGINFRAAAQFTVGPQAKYYIDAPDNAKAPYLTLPPPDLGGVPSAGSDLRPPPFASVAAAQAAEPSLKPADAVLLTTGASGLAATHGPDTRIANVTNLPNGPFQFTAKDPRNGQGLPYDAYSEDTIHRFFQMWQQSDCAIRHATRHNPSGCQSDLYPFVTTTFLAPSEQGSGSPMAFFNMSRGDAPYLKSLADRYTLADNYHQAAMGGTGVQHIMLGTGDLFFFSDGNGHPLVPPGLPAVLFGLPPTAPPIPLIANPDPIPGTNNHYINDLLATTGIYVNCSDTAQPGVPAITGYLQSLPFRVAPNCATGSYYALNNIFPGFHPDGRPASPANVPPAADGSDFVFIPPSNVPTIGDALIAKNISWRYYGGGYNDAIAGRPNAFCPICNPMQYVSSIMANAAVRTEHTKDVIDLFADIAGNRLPAVSFVKPSELVDGHPLSSKLDLFEAFLRNIVERIEAKPELFEDTLILATFDESGGYYDSGFIQPLDFFGDGPRVPLLLISPHTRGGRVVHTYYDHVSILKFIERNWGLGPLSGRSRDNLPNPVAREDNPYVPRNMPAIGDLVDLFDHKDSDGDSRHDRD
ncbi:MAG: alkaline phosphatase family protein [Xanthobacteraceae bacterium]